MSVYRPSPANGYCLWLLVALFALADLPAMSPMALGQYDSDPVQDLGRYGVSAAKRYARSPSGSAEDRTMFGKFIRDKYFPAMTQNDAASLAKLAKLRYDFMRSFLWSAAPQVQSDVTQLAFNEMSRIVKGRYHPAVRYNAMLIVGQLDATYSGNNDTPPKPLPAANEYLTRVVSAGLNQAQAPAWLIVGAMIGLERHAAVLNQLPAANRTATVAALLAVLEKDKFPQEISASVSQRLKVIAARGLAGVGVLGDGNRVHEAMMASVGNEQWRLNNRVRIVEMLASYQPAYESVAGLNERSTVQKMLQLSSDLSADEKERAIEYEDETLRTGGGGGSFDFGRDAEIPDTYQTRRLLFRLRGLKNGIVAVKPAIKDAKLVALLDQVVTAIDPVISSCTERNVILLNLTRDVKQMADQVASISASLGVEAVEAPPESDEEAAEEMLEEEAIEAAAPDA